MSYDFEPMEVHPEYDYSEGKERRFRASGWENGFKGCLCVSFDGDDERTKAPDRWNPPEIWAESMTDAYHARFILDGNRVVFNGEEDEYPWAVSLDQFLEIAEVFKKEREDRISRIVE